jgi:hypothetical protein
MGRAWSTNGAKRNAYRILVVKPEGKRPLGRSKYRWVGLREIGVGIAVDKATGCGLDDRWAGVPVGSRIFSSPCRSDRLWGSPNLLSNGYRGALSPAVKRSGREADHAPPASAIVKKMWIYTSTSPYAFMA